MIINFVTPKKKLSKQILFVWLFVFINFLGYGIFAQQSKNDSSSKNKLTLTLAFIDIKPTDSIVDIGSGSGYSILPIVTLYPNLLFTLQDIDSSTLNIKNITKKIRKLSNEDYPSKLNIVYGIESKTNLPKASFNKILMFDVIHELTYKAEMLKDITEVMSLNGSLFVEEIIVHKPQKKDKACSYPFFTDEAFKKLMFENNFNLIKEQITLNTNRNKYKKLYQFKVK